ncbi:hypothetical protein P691DRAFT_807529 [Macrolepiota fuliginosa MF-IS2]|uniref:ABM domain-containing protein n=1 Tax=Macrolepiota fuliginosa MF-IS2 TaxID=1400762 RepID=A0A9P5X719_9AGAR|nr:hypothetical protein P691DRAFT_807529 [Macrolepiota fuliginosa MF-IS2]
MSALLAPEIIWFSPSEFYLEDPDHALRAVNNSSSERGLLDIYYGFEEQDPSVGVWVMAWHTLDAHQSFMEHEAYIDFALPVMEAMVGFGDITQVLLSQRTQFHKAISSPITQFVYITLRPRHDRTYELTPLVENLTAELMEVPGCYGSSWGPSVEHDNVYVGVVGWRSLSDRDCGMNGAVSLTIAQIQEVGTVELKYTQLRLHEP